MTRQEMIQDIIDVLEYEDGNFYVGSIAKAIVHLILNVKYPHGDLIQRLTSAVNEKTKEVWDYLKNDIKYMKAHPKVECPHCGQLMDKEEE